MKIEESLQLKKPFRNDWQKAMVNLIYTHNWVVERVKNHLQPFDITIQQFNVLRIVKGAGKPISTSIIRDRMMDKMSDASRIVNRLERKQLISKQSCKSDRRLVDVKLSSKGLKLLDKIEERILEIDAIMNNLSDDESTQLSELLDKIRV